MKLYLKWVLKTKCQFKIDHKVLLLKSLGFRASTIISTLEGCFLKDIHFHQESESVENVEEAPKKKKVLGVNKKKAREEAALKNNHKITNFFQQNA